MVRKMGVGHLMMSIRLSFVRENRNGWKKNSKGYSLRCTVLWQGLIELNFRVQFELNQIELNFLLFEMYPFFCFLVETFLARVFSGGSEELIFN